MWLFATVAAVGYLLGSIPNGYIAGRMAGIDVRDAGSGNIGATNVLRLLGKKYGYPVFAADLLKGFAAVRWAMFHAAAVGAPDLVQVCGIVAAVSCVIGHSFPVWLRFRGGKGVATSAGTLLGLMPFAVLAIFAVWVVVFETSRFVSLASVAAAAVLPVVVFVMLQLGALNATSLLYFSVAIAAVVIWRHRSNIRRLIAGTEPRFARK